MPVFTHVESATIDASLHELYDYQYFGKLFPMYNSCWPKPLE